MQKRNILKSPKRYIMYSDYDYKEVYYHEYCEKCKHWEKADLEEPCNECLDNFMNLHSHKPINFEEKEE